MHALAYWERQFRHWLRSSSVSIGPAHDCPPGTVTFGQLAAAPISAGERSSDVPHRPSPPPHAVQILPVAFWTALLIAARFGVFGQLSELMPESTRSSQRSVVRNRTSNARVRFAPRTIW